MKKCPFKNASKAMIKAIVAENMSKKNVLLRGIDVLFIIR